MMRKTYIIASIALLAGTALGYYASSFSGNIVGGSAPTLTAESGEKEALYWVAPMDPNFQRDTPGKSPMGMDLIPVYAGPQGGNEDALRIDAAVVNNIGVRSEIATVSDLFREVNTVGFLTVDETKTAHVHVRSAGWVDKLYRKAMGERVNKGELIFELYSPNLVSAQAELLQAVRLKNSGLTNAAAERLVVLGMSRSEIAELKSSGKVKERIEVRAPQDGIITMLSIGEGMHVTPGKTVFSLADLSTIWVKAEVFEGQSAWVAQGQKATMKLPFLPGETWTGVVDYVYPIVDMKSRTVQVRLAFDNADGRLKPNMYGEISLAAKPVKNALSIPREALIRTGKTDRVILSLGDGRFRPAEVVAGLESGGRVEIKAGLKAGEEVVTSGQFLIDSEASLSGAFLRMLESNMLEGEIADMTDMAGMDKSPGLDAEPDMGSELAMSSEPSVNSEIETELHHGMGTVVAFNDDGTVTLEHGPIASLDWPDMTMDFKVASDVDLSVFTEGDRMHFTLRQSPEGPYVIITAMIMSGEDQS